MNSCCLNTCIVYVLHALLPLTCMQSVNKAMQKDKDELVVGVLDIYGFEIFMVS